jgi:hypothetical protein
VGMARVLLSQDSTLRTASGLKLVTERATMSPPGDLPAGCGPSPDGTENEDSGEHSTHLPASARVDGSCSDWPDCLGDDPRGDEDDNGERR